MTQDPRSKTAVVLKLLEEGDAMLCLDARHEGVVVPPQHASDPSLRLVLNLNFPHPIDVTEAGVSANLAFGGRRFNCYIPMDALWAAFDPETMQGMMWAESMPKEVQDELAAQQEQPAAGPKTERPAASKAPVAPSPAPKAKREDPAGAASTPRQRGHLRVVK